MGQQRLAGGGAHAHDPGLDDHSPHLRAGGSSRRPYALRGHLRPEMPGPLAWRGDHHGSSGHRSPHGTGQGTIASRGERIAPLEKVGLMRVKGGASGHSRLLRRRPPNAQARCTWLVDDPSASQADFILPGARVTERLVDPGSLLLLTFRATSRDRHLPHRCACSLGSAAPTNRPHQSPEVAHLRPCRSGKPRGRSLCPRGPFSGGRIAWRTSTS